MSAPFPHPSPPFLYPSPPFHIRSLFLECRDRWISDLRRDLDPRNAYEFLKRLTDLVRLQLFDVATQYRALFPDDDAAHLGAFVARQAQAYLA